MKKYFLVLALAGSFFLQPALAQLNAPPTHGTQVQIPPPLIRAQVSAQEQAIELTRLSIQTQIYANIATTTYDMTFYNPNNRVLEGELEFPLFGNQRVVGYSLDINGHQRAGIVTEKQFARQVFEEKVRQGIDPGLIEKTAGNNYKTRIYPLLAKQTRRITITYEEILNKQQNHYLYDLALNFTQPIKEFSYEAKLLELSQQPELIEALSGISFQREGQSGYFAKVEKSQFTPNQNIKIRVPVQHDIQQFYEQYNNDLYAFVNVPLEETQLASPLKPKPKNIAIVWDDSLSSIQGGRNIRQEARLLAKYLAYLNINADVYTFDTVFEKQGQYSASQIEKTLTALPAISGTDFSVIDTKVLNGYEEVIIVSDGLANLGEQSIKEQLKTRVITLNSAAKSNERYLEYLADGQLVNLNKITIEEALATLQIEPLIVSEILYDKNVVQEIYHSSLRVTGQNLSLLAKLNAPQTTLQLVFKKGNQTFERTVEININNKGQTKGISRLFGAEKIHSLEVNAKKNEKEIINTAKQFTIVTDYTSLIVLDDVSDYVQYQITPPAELKQAYDELLKQQNKSKKEKLNRRLSSLKTTFNTIKEWYNKEYSTKKNEPRYIAKGRSPFESQESIASMALSRAPSTELEFSTAQRSIAAGAPQMLRMRRDDTEPSPDPTTKTITIKLQAWTPDASYLQEIKKANKADLKAVYFSLQIQYIDQPAFYMDMADFFQQKGDKAFAARIVLGIADLNLENIELLRALGHKLVELEQYDYALEIFEKLVQLRGEDQQSYRDLGLIYEKIGHPQKALEKLYHALIDDFSQIHPGVNQTLLMELNHLITRYPNLDISRVDRDLIESMPVDLRIVIDWNIDNTDIDLWVTDPNGYKVYYSAPLSPAGGRITKDVTTGFGPEEFTLKKASEGTYKIQVQYYSSHSQKVNAYGAAMVKATVFTNYGRKDEKSQEMMVRLEKNKKLIDIGEFNY